MIIFLILLILIALAIAFALFEARKEIRFQRKYGHRAPYVRTAMKHGAFGPEL